MLSNLQFVLFLTTESRSPRSKLEREETQVTETIVQTSRATSQTPRGRQRVPCALAHIIISLLLSNINLLWTWRHKIKHWLTDWWACYLFGGRGDKLECAVLFFFFSVFNEWFEVSLTTLLLLFYLIFSLAALQFQCPNLVFLEYVSLCAHKLSLFLSLSLSLSVCLSVSVCLSFSISVCLCPPPTPPSSTSQLSFSVYPVLSLSQP